MIGKHYSWCKYHKRYKVQLKDVSATPSSVHLGYASSVAEARHLLNTFEGASAKTKKKRRTRNMITNVELPSGRWVLFRGRTPLEQIYDSDERVKKKRQNLYWDKKNRVFKVFLGKKYIGVAKSIEEL